MRAGAISLVAMEARDPAKAFVRVPNEPGRWVYTDRGVVEVSCEICGSVRGELCISRPGKYIAGTHYCRRIDWKRKHGRSVDVHEEDVSKPRIRIMGVIGEY